MPVRYDPDTKARAIRLVREHAGDYPSEYAAITVVARRLGMTPETLRKWMAASARVVYEKPPRDLFLFKLESHQL